MGKAFVCDRCNEFDTDEPIACVTFSWPKQTGSSAQDRKDYELCTNCLASLHDWIELKPTHGLVFDDGGVSGGYQ